MGATASRGPVDSSVAIVSNSPPQRSSVRRRVGRHAQAQGQGNGPRPPGRGPLREGPARQLPARQDGGQAHRQVGCASLGPRRGRPCPATVALMNGPHVGANRACTRCRHRPGRLAETGPRQRTLNPPFTGSNPVSPAGAEWSDAAEPRATSRLLQRRRFPSLFPIRPSHDLRSPCNGEIPAGAATRLLLLPRGGSPAAPRYRPCPRSI